MSKAEGFKLPDPDEKDTQKSKWAQSNYKLAPSSQSIPTPPKSAKIQANFFRIRMNTNQDKRLYRVVLGQIQGITITNRDAKRVFIDDILTVYPPTVQIWVTDHHSYIVSSGSLYNDPTLPYGVGAVIQALHNQTSSAGVVLRQLASFIIHERNFDFPGSQNYVNPAIALPLGYFPDEDLKILNILSWQHIHNDPQQFKSVGEKIYPVANNNPRNLTSGSQNVYIMRHGFFPSVRPGDTSLLLNVNTTTTAFYSPITLQAWIDRRLGRINARPTLKLQSELRNLKVTFDPDARPRKAWKLTGFSQIGNGTVQAQHFSRNNVQISVYDYMRTVSKFLALFIN